MDNRLSSIFDRFTNHHNISAGDYLYMEYCDDVGTLRQQLKEWIRNKIIKSPMVDISLMFAELKKLCDYCNSLSYFPTLKNARKFYKLICELFIKKYNNCIENLTFDKYVELKPEEMAFIFSVLYIQDADSQIVKDTINSPNIISLLIDWLSDAHIDIYHNNNNIDDFKRDPYVIDVYIAMLFDDAIELDDKKYPNPIRPYAQKFREEYLNKFYLHVNTSTNKINLDHMHGINVGKIQSELQELCKIYELWTEHFDVLSFNKTDKINNGFACKFSDLPEDFNNYIKNQIKFMRDEYELIMAGYINISIITAGGQTKNLKVSMFQALIIVLLKNNQILSLTNNAFNNYPPKIIKSTLNSLIDESIIRMINEQDFVFDYDGIMDKPDDYSLLDSFKKHMQKYYSNNQYY